MLREFLNSIYTPVSFIYKPSVEQIYVFSHMHQDVIDQYAELLTIEPENATDMTVESVLEMLEGYDTDSIKDEALNTLNCMEEAKQSLDTALDMDMTPTLWFATQLKLATEVMSPSDASKFLVRLWSTILNSCYDWHETGQSMVAARLQSEFKSELILEEEILPLLTTVRTNQKTLEWSNNSLFVLAASMVVAAERVAKFNAVMLHTMPGARKQDIKKAILSHPIACKPLTGDEDFDFKFITTLVFLLSNRQGNFEFYHPKTPVSIFATLSHFTHEYNKHLTIYSCSDESFEETSARIQKTFLSSWAGAMLASYPKTDAFLNISTTCDRLSMGLSQGILFNMMHSGPAPEGANPEPIRFSKELDPFS